MFFAAISFVKFQIYFSVPYVVLAKNMILSNKSKSKSNNINNLKLVPKKYLNKLVVANLNINLIRNKFEALMQNVSGGVDLLMTSETKIDERFPKSQFLIKGFSDPFRIDRNSHRGGVLLYVKENILTKLVSVEAIPSEIYILKLQ